MQTFATHSGTSTGDHSTIRSPSSLLDRLCRLHRRNSGIDMVALTASESGRFALPASGGGGQRRSAPDCAILPITNFSERL